MILILPRMIKLWMKHRTIDINGNSLTFHGEKDIIINENGNINIDEIQL